MVRHSNDITRATFLKRAAVIAAAAALSRPRLARAAQLFATQAHPDPRDGITAEKVLSDEAIRAGLKRAPRDKALKAYAAARAYPALFDGIACTCSCANGMHRSLLTCYETLQPTGCGSCEEAGLLVGKLAGEGKALADIRKAIDKDA